MIEAPRLLVPNYLNRQLSEWMITKIRNLDAAIDTVFATRDGTTDFTREAVEIYDLNHLLLHPENSHKDLVFNRRSTAFEPTLCVMVFGEVTSYPEIAFPLDKILKETFLKIPLVLSINDHGALDIAPRLFSRGIEYRSFTHVLESSPTPP